MNDWKLQYYWKTSGTWADLDFAYNVTTDEWVCAGSLDLIAAFLSRYCSGEYRVMHIPTGNVIPGDWLL